MVSEIQVLEDTPDPSLEIMGLDLVVEANDADYDLEITDLDLQNVVNITWYYNGMEVCNGPNCTELTLIKLVEGGELLVELEYGDGCILPASKTIEINEVNAVYIPNMVDWSGTALPPDNEWKAYLKGSEAFITSVQVFDRWGNMVKDYENKSMDYFKEFLIWLLS